MSLVRRAARRVLESAGRNRPAPPAWVVDEPSPAVPQPLPDVKLFAVIGTWMEEDVVAATVANAFTQGCERVLLVDNDSTDGTVAAAVAAGAELAATFGTDEYDESLRLATMNRVVQDASEADGGDHIWWLWVDADEFPHGPRGLTIAEYVRTLDRRFRIVGGRFVNHFPSGAPEYIPGFHPLDFQPLSEEHRHRLCARQHRKHPLQRFDRNGPPIVCDLGFHRASSEERPLREPTDAVYVHHFPYRDRDVTRRRLDLLCGADRISADPAIASSQPSAGMVQRIQSFDAVYAGDWSRAAELRIAGDYDGVEPVPWPLLAGAADADFARWYTAEDLAAARRVHATPVEEGRAS